MLLDKYAGHSKATVNNENESVSDEVLLHRIYDIFNIGDVREKLFVKFSLFATTIIIYGQICPTDSV